MGTGNIAELNIALTAKIGDLERKLGRIEKRVFTFRKSATKSFNAVRNASRRVSSGIATLRRSFVGLAAGVSAAAVAFDATRTIMAYEKTMAELQGVTNATAGTMEKFNATARELGATTAFSAAEAGQGLLFLSRAGFTADEAIAALPGTLDLAIAGNLELADAADKASNIVSAFGLSASETNRVVDSMVQVANSANTNVEQLADAMKFAAPVAASLGVSVEEASAAIGVLSDSGIQGSLAGTNLRAMMAALVKPTEKAKKAIEGMGLSVDELSPKTNSMADIFRKLQGAGLEAEQAIDIFGVKMQAGALVLANGADRLDELRIGAEGAGGAAKRMADIMGNTLQGKLKSLRSTVEELYLRTGDAGLTGALKSAVDQATSFLRTLIGIETNASKAAESIQRVTTVATFAAKVAGVVADGWRMVEKAWLGLRISGAFISEIFWKLKDASAAVSQFIATKFSQTWDLLKATATQWAYAFVVDWRRIEYVGAGVIKYLGIKFSDLLKSMSKGLRLFKDTQGLANQVQDAANAVRNSVGTMGAEAARNLSKAKDEMAKLNAGTIAATKAVFSAVTVEGDKHARAMAEGIKIQRDALAKELSDLYSAEAPSEIINATVDRFIAGMRDATKDAIAKASNAYLQEGGLEGPAMAESGIVKIDDLFPSFDVIAERQAAIDEMHAEHINRKTAKTKEGLDEEEDQRKRYAMIALSGASSMFKNLSTLQKSNNKTAQRLGKATAKVAIVADTATAAMRAYAAMSVIPIVGPALGAAAAAAAMVAGAQRLRESQSGTTIGAGGGASGGSIGGASPDTPDTSTGNVGGIATPVEPVERPGKFVMPADRFVSTNDIAEIVNEEGRRGFIFDGVELA